MPVSRGMVKILRSTDRGGTNVSDQVQRLLDRLEAAWAALTESYTGVPESRLVEPGVVDD